VAHVRDGMSIAIGCALEPAIPFAFAHELIRQRKRELTLIGPISDILFDQLIGAGCVARVEAAWVGNVSAGLGHCYRRALEQGIPRRIEVRDYSNFSIAQALLAGAIGAPYIPTRTLLGSDIARTNTTLKESTSPFDGTKVLLIPPIVPDLTVIACQWSDENGGARLDGPLGVSHEAALAARSVVVLAEHVLARTSTQSVPGQPLFPPTNVVAVVEEPGACHPSPLQGRYRRDHDFYHEYHAATRDVAGFDRWLADWVADVSDRAGYLRKLGTRWERLREEGTPAAEVRY
jgi:glutaconate CoA-transferase subunit A